MIKVADGKMGTREFTSIILLSIGMKITDSTPSQLYIAGENAAWMMPLFFIILIGVPFFILLSLMKKHQKGLIDLIFSLTGKYLGTIITFSLFLMLSIGVIWSVRSYITIVNTAYFQQAPIQALLFLMLLFCFFVAKRGLETISRSAWFIIPTIEILLIVLIVSVWKEVDWMRIFPIAGPGFKQLIKESASTSGLFSELILLTAFFSFTRSYKSFRLAAFIGFTISCFKMVLFLALYVAVFDYPSTLKMLYPHQQLTRIAEFGESMSHVEGVFFIFWMVGSIIRFSIYLYLIAFLFAGSLRLDKFEPLVLPLTGLIFLGALLFENVFILNPFRRQFFSIVSWILMLLPFILWVIDRWKGRRKNEASKSSLS